MDEILLNETQKVSADREAPQFLDYDHDENDLYQVESMSLEDTKENLNDVSVRLNANKKVNMGLKIKMVCRINMTKK